MTLPRHFIVNYHHVAPAGDGLASHPLSPEAFDRHLALLSKTHRVVSIPDVAAAAGSAEPLAAITFDDGLRSQCENAAPILEARGMRAAFFPVTATWDGFLPAQHKAHLLFPLLGEEALAEELEAFLAAQGLAENFPIPRDRRLVADRRLHDDVLTANVKETLAGLPHEAKERFLGGLLARRGIDESSLAAWLFAGRDEIAGLAARGHMIGCHTHRHLAADALSAEEFRAELAASLALLRETVGSSPAVFSYPSGRVRVDGEGILREAGFTHAVTVERRGLSRGENPYRLPRLDANDLENLLGR